ncbi:MAG TPA: polysaccharide biosynthesis tyrosine autokinase [Acidobacteriaceae bacterium]|nr:polysaccharide biosynthesis tyrosine autokinase [Acidobacteriaceae bacterium]
MQQVIRSKPVSPVPEAKDVSLTDLWLVVRKRRVLLLSLALGVGLLAALAGFVRGKKYTATGEIQIRPGSASELKQSISLALGSTSTLDVVMESDIRILQSEKLLGEVAEKLDLQNNPDFMGRGGRLSVKPAFLSDKSVPAPPQSLDDPVLRNAVIGNLRGHLTVTRIPRTQMITIAYTSSSPKLSSAVVNELETAFIQNNFSTHFNTTREVSKWLTQQMDDLRQVVQDSQNKMVDLQRKLGVMALDPEHNLMVQEIANLEKNVADASEQRVLAEARYRILRSLPPDQIQESPPNTPGAIGSEGLLANLRAQRASVASDLAHLQPLYGPNYPQVKQLRAQSDAVNGEIEEQEHRVLEEANASFNLAQTAENKARELLNDKTQELYGQRDDLVQYMLLSQEYDSNRKMYESIVGRLREAAVDAGLDSADISIVDLASTPLRPSSSSPLRLGIIGTLFGLFGGFTLALFMEKMDTRLRDAHEIQEILGLPSLAMIPQSHWKSKGSELEWVVGPELLRDPRSPFAESFRALRTSMRLSTTSRESKVIAVTSCQPSEGKSTVSVNMAAVLAQGGKKVALVDTDMRRPSVYKRLRLEGGKGLSEVLTGYYTLDEVTQTHETLTTLDVIPSGTVPPLPADLLASDQMTEVVRQLRQRYDYVIFDTPPVLSVTDPAIVAAQADGMVLVIRQGYCTRRMLARAAEILHELDVKVYGFVFNGVDASLPEYYGYLGYYTYEYGK